MKIFKNIAVITLLLLSCGNLRKQATEESVSMQPIGPVFNADSAYSYCEAQCAFGPRTMNSEAHEACGKWIAEKFASFGMAVSTQKADLKGFDGTILKSTNIIASFKPEVTNRILLCAHWDSRPWADNDPDEANHKKPVMAANDGASGVAVMLEVARLLPDSLGIGVDFICFDAEDWGIPQWSDAADDGNSWALGAQYWAAHPHKQGYKANFGILLDMVGGQGAKFYREGMSQQYANAIVKKVWRAAYQAGYGSYFPKEDGGIITDDHIPVNQNAQIPTIDIIPYYPDCQQSTFGPTWHTVSDDMQHLDKATLNAVGQTLIQVLYTEE
jgi:hypothetical protein